MEQKILSDRGVKTLYPNGELVFGQFIMHESVRNQAAGVNNAQ